MTKDFWNERYHANEKVYGDEANIFFKDQLKKIAPGKLLLPAEGEGRNAIYAASQGWKVSAFDFSQEAQVKALARAAALKLTIDYTVADMQLIKLPAKEFDVVALIYVHLPEQLRREFLGKCVDSLKPGGAIIIEGFNKKQLNNTSGGPKQLEYLYSLDGLKKELGSLNYIIAEETQIQLDEGPFHAGVADVVRVVAKKV